MAQSVKQPTLDFGSGHDLVVREFEPRIGADSTSLLGILSLSLCPSPACMCALSLSQ